MMLNIFSRFHNSINDGLFDAMSDILTIIIIVIL